MTDRVQMPAARGRVIPEIDSISDDLLALCEHITAVLLDVSHQAESESGVSLGQKIPDRPKQKLLTLFVLNCTCSQVLMSGKNCHGKEVIMHPVP